MKLPAVALLLASLVLPASGCMTLRRAHPFPDEHPYVRSFNADPATTLRAVEDALAKLSRLPVEEEVPGDRSRGLVANPEFPQYYGWIYTDQKLHFWIVITTSNTLNIFLRAREDNRTDVIINYQRSKSIAPFYDYCYYTYRNDGYVRRIFDRISRSLGSIDRTLDKAEQSY
jgi:hypothetical protein